MFRSAIRGTVTKSRDTHEVRVAVEKVLGVQFSRPEYLVEMMASAAIRR